MPTLLDVAVAANDPSEVRAALARLAVARRTAAAAPAAAPEPPAPPRPALRRGFLDSNNTNTDGGAANAKKRAKAKARKARAKTAAAAEPSAPPPAPVAKAKPRPAGKAELPTCPPAVLAALTVEAKAAWLRHREPLGDDPTMGELQEMAGGYMADMMGQAGAAIQAHDAELVARSCTAEGAAALATPAGWAEWGLPPDCRGLRGSTLGRGLQGSFQWRVRNLKDAATRAALTPVGQEDCYRQAARIAAPRWPRAARCVRGGGGPVAAAHDFVKNGYVVIDGLLDAQASSETYASALQTFVESGYATPSNNPCNVGSLGGAVMGEVSKIDSAGPGGERVAVEYPHVTAAANAAMKLAEGLVGEIARAGYAHPLRVPTQWRIGTYPPGRHVRYTKHLDNYEGVEASNYKEVTVLLYLNHGWDADKDGGQLRLLQGPDGDDGHRDVAPVCGRVVAFTSRSQWHEVLPADSRHRIALTLWVERDDVEVGG